MLLQTSPLNDERVMSAPLAIHTLLILALQLVLMLPIRWLEVAVLTLFR